MSKNDKVKGLILLAVFSLILYLNTKSIFITIETLAGFFLVFLIFGLPILLLLDSSKLSLKRSLTDIVKTALSDKNDNKKG